MASIGEEVVQVERMAGRTRTAFKAVLGSSPCKSYRYFNPINVLTKCARFLGEIIEFPNCFRAKYYYIKFRLVSLLKQFLSRTIIVLSGGMKSAFLSYGRSGTANFETEDRSSVYNV